ncbi:4'-phosphopantetheinyl transferase family protein [Aquimarina muelleri]|uniref:4'-phosphopantetheinyl transferase family protein n=1 Tax=Aquimarina muelleri TaxID=279356 RepID=UPI003F683861
MIGNDIVDLQVAKVQSNWQRRGWLQKICTSAEQKDILSSKNPEMLVWKYWSMKEATYKAHQRHFKLSPVFNPKSFECTLGGKVYVDSFVYKTNTEIQNKYIYTIAMISNKDCFSSIYENIVDISSKVKKILCQKLNIPISLIYLEKDNNGVPTIRIDQKTTPIPISITHHGQYSAFVALI